MDNPAAALQNQCMGADFLRTMAWLGKERVTAYLRIVAFLNVVLLLALVVTSRAGIDVNGHLIGSDFLSFWTVGQMLHAHADIYDGAAHIAVQREFFAASDGYTAFFYPPSFLPFCWPLGFFGYFAAFGLWLAVTGAFYLLAVRQWWQKTDIPLPLWLLLTAFPPVAIVITHGQTSFLVAALLGLGALLVPGRPVLAGVLFGLATIKPQFGVLVPWVLLLSWEWRAFGSAALTAMVLALACALVFGIRVWPEWFAASERAREAMEAGGVPFGKMITAFAAARLLGLPTGAAYAVQWMISAAVLGALAGAAWKSRYSPSLGAAMLAGAPLATPFALDYDLVLLAFPLLWLAGEGLRSGFAPYEKLAMALAFIVPVFARPLALSAGVPIAPLVIAFLFIVILRRALMHKEHDSAVARLPD